MRPVDVVPQAKARVRRESAALAAHAQAASRSVVDLSPVAEVPEAPRRKPSASASWRVPEPEREPESAPGPVSDRGGSFVVHVLGARNLDGLADPFCTLTCAGSEYPRLVQNDPCDFIDCGFPYGVADADPLTVVSARRHKTPVVRQSCEPTWEDARYQFTGVGEAEELTAAIFR